MEHRVTRSGVAAVFGSRARNDDRCDPPLAKNEIKVRRKECAIAMLLDNVFTRSGSETREDLDARCSIDQGRVVSNRWIQVVIKAHIGPVTSMYVSCVDDPDALLSAELES